MHIDLPTLMIAGSFVAAASGGFLAFAWLQHRDEKGPLWWAAANLALACGVPLLASSGSAFGMPSMIVGILLLNLSPALIWAAACSCNRKRPNGIVVAAGAVIWLFAFATAFRPSMDAQMAANLALVSVYLFAAAEEFWAGRTERLSARWPLIVLLCLHGLFFAVGAGFAAFGALQPSGPPSVTSWFGMILFETLVFVVGTAIFSVAMVKERSELAHITASRVDSLTGVANRRAFMEQAEDLLAACLNRDSPLALVVFDLDRFKEINDAFGHATGDRVLEKFGQTVREILRESDLVGRPGGEEFAIVLPGSSAGAAYVVAQRVREAFTEACGSVGAGVAGFRPTVSGGVAAAHPDSSLDGLLAAADRALYEAKARGRNQIAITERDRPREWSGAAPDLAAQAA